MITSMARMSMLLAALLLSVAFARAQETKIKNGAVKRTSAASGEEMFKEYCAVCHGKTGKGDGPAAAALKPSPANLTMLAKNNGGKFPAEHMQAVLSMGAVDAAHGSKDMPIWGHIFGTFGLQGQDSIEVRQRIFNLSKYVESLQER